MNYTQNYPPLEPINKEALRIFQTELTKAGAKIVSEIPINWRKQEQYSVNSYVYDFNSISQIELFSERYIKPAIGSLIQLLDTVIGIRFLDLPSYPSKETTSFATENGISLRVSRRYDAPSNIFIYQFDTMIEFDGRYIQNSIQASTQNNDLASPTRVIRDQQMIQNFQQTVNSTPITNPFFATTSTAVSQGIYANNELNTYITSAANSVFSSVEERESMFSLLRRMEEQAIAEGRINPNYEQMFRKEEKQSAPESDGKIRLDLDKAETNVEKIMIPGHEIDLE